MRKEFQLTIPFDANSRTAASWWEKTVEYAFVRDFMPSAHKAFPLDGNAEKAFGDLVTKGCDGFRLIEFKARSSDIASEKKKYPSFQKPPANGNNNGTFHSLLAECEPNIATHDGRIAHWLIYGKPERDESGFSLEARPYAGDGSVVVTLAEQGDIFQLTTVVYEVLLGYLRLLEKARGSSVGTGTAVGSRLMIVGVKGGKMLALTEEEFRSPYPKAEAKQEPRLTDKASPATPRRRMP